MPSCHSNVVRRSLPYFVLTNMMQAFSAKVLVERVRHVSKHLLDYETPAG